jgi:uncharacterized protein YjcR
MSKIVENRLANPTLLHMHQASRCPAKSKRSGLQRRSPAVRGCSVCRMHGSAGGAPKGNRNARKHGLYSAESVEMRRLVRELTRQGRELIERI